MEGPFTILKFKVDPFLRLVGDRKLQAVTNTSNNVIGVYGSKEDDADAAKSLLAIDIPESGSKESMISIIMSSLPDLSDILETARQVGRFSVSTTPDLPFTEMTSHCEALLVGKQQKMSALMGPQLKQDAFFGDLSQDHNQVKQPPFWYTDQLQMSSNPFLEPSFNAYTQRPPGASAGFCSTEIQNQPQFLRFTASSPIDDFLGASSF